MKTLLSVTFIAVLLCGCPDSKLPIPPKAPEPKLGGGWTMGFDKAAQLRCLAVNGRTA